MNPFLIRFNLFGMQWEDFKLFWLILQKDKGQDSKAEISCLDKEIDQLVYELYGLTEEEIEIVEGGTKDE